MEKLAILRPAFWRHHPALLVHVILCPCLLPLTFPLLAVLVGLTPLAAPFAAYREWIKVALVVVLSIYLVGGVLHWAFHRPLSRPATKAEGQPAMVEAE